MRLLERAKEVAVEHSADTDAHVSSSSSSARDHSTSEGAAQKDMDAAAVKRIVPKTIRESVSESV